MRNIIACLTNSYGRFGARAALDLLPATGVRHLELPIRTQGVPSSFGDEPLVTDGSTGPEIARVRELLAEKGVELASCGVMSGNPLERPVVDLVRRKLDVAAQLGAKLVVGAAGEVEEPSQLDVLYRHLREIGDHCAALQIVYCFETHPGICAHHSGMLQTMHDLAHPHLKLNFDTANILYYNEHVNGEIALAKVCHFVRHVHLKDSQGEYGRWYFPALGRGGAVDFVRVLQLLKVCGFRGPYSIEIEGIAGEGELSLEQHHQRVAESVEHLRQCGYFDEMPELSPGPGSDAGGSPEIL